MLRKALVIATAATVGVGLSGCAALLGAGAGAAAAAVYQDENNVCDPPTPAGVLDDDC